MIVEAREVGKGMIENPIEEALGHLTAHAPGIGVDLAQPLRRARLEAVEPSFQLGELEEVAAQG